MEKDQNIGIFPLRCSWNDLGSWDTIAEINKKVKNKNELIFEHQVKDSYVISDQCRIVTIGIENLIVVSHKNDILIIKKGHSQDIKTVLNKIQK